MASSSSTATTAKGALDKLAGIRPNLSRPRLPLIAAGIVIVAAIAGLAYWKHHTSTINARWDRAADAFGRADYDKAAKELKGLSEPSSPERLRVYSQTMLATHQLDKSLAGYQKLYAINKDPSVQLIMGNIYSEQKKYEDAAKIYQKAISDNPANAQAYVNLATMYKMQGNMSSAIATANQGVTNNPGSITLHQLKVSMLLENKSDPQYQAAVTSLKALSPNDPLLASLAK